MWLSNSKKYAMDGFLEERASGGSVHQVVGNGSWALFDCSKQSRPTSCLEEGGELATLYDSKEILPMLPIYQTRPCSSC
jgi:hypothetical protein